MNQPKYRRPLNAHQIAILNTLYKFRFTTIALLAENQQAKHQRVIASRLKILVDQGYIGMNYDSSYKIAGKPATYYLLPEGVRYLRYQPYTQESALRSIYQDKRVEPHRIAHRLHVFKAYIHIKQAYPDRFKFFSKTELMHKPYVPKIHTRCISCRYSNKRELLFRLPRGQHELLDTSKNHSPLYKLRGNGNMAKTQN
jgi:hypothetical protein